MLVWPPHGLPDAADGFAESRRENVLQKWVMGVIVALIPAVYGIRCVIAGATTIIGRRGWVAVTGWAGVAFAIAFVSLACWLHFHYFWANHHRLWRFSELGKFVALVTFAVSVLIGFVAFVAFG